MQLPRNWATIQKVAGSIPDGVTVIFHWHNPSSRTMAPGSTQSLTEMSTRNISWGVKAASAQGQQPYHLHVLTVLKSRTLSLLETFSACTRIALPLPLPLPEWCIYVNILLHVTLIILNLQINSSSADGSTVYLRTGKIFILSLCYKFRLMYTAIIMHREVSFVMDSFSPLHWHIYITKGSPIYESFI